MLRIGGREQELWNEIISEEYFFFSQAISETLAGILYGIKQWRQKACQRVHEKISVIIANTFVFKTKR